MVAAVELTVSVGSRPVAWVPQPVTSLPGKVAQGYPGEAAPGNIRKPDGEDSLLFSRTGIPDLRQCSSQYVPSLLRDWRRLPASILGILFSYCAPFAFPRT